MRRAGGWMEPLGYTMTDLTDLRRAPAGVVEPWAGDLRPRSRAVTDGRFLSLDGAPFRVRGVTYGSFMPRWDGEPFPEAVRVRRDFAAIASAGLNTVRTYTLPPEDVLDLAEEAGLHLLVGLHYEDWRDETQPGRGATRRV